MLDLAHKKLEAAFFPVYGWPADLADEEILERGLKPVPPRFPSSIFFAIHRPLDYRRNT